LNDNRESKAAIPPAAVTRRVLGVPWLFAVAYAGVGFSIYFAIGIVADRGLGLTPLIFLGVGVVFILNTLTYVEGAAMFRERGGSANFARHAFNDLVGFIAGWAILIDYIIVIALAAISVPHYLTPIAGTFGNTGEELAAAIAVILLVAWLSIIGATGRGHQRLLTAIAGGGLLLLLAVIVVGAITSWDPAALTAELDLFSTPSLQDIVYAGVVATVAYAGIEAASNLAPDLEFRPAELRKVVTVGATLVPLLYAGVAAVALMAVPVMPTPDGPHTALGGADIEEPILGVVQNFEPGWVSSVMEAAVVVVAPVVLVWAASVSMLGLSRHVYVLATNRQIPSWLGKLGRRHVTPHVAILAAAVIAIGLVIPADVKFLGGLFAFGATIAFTIAHVSIVRLRRLEPDRPRPFRMPLNVRVGGWELPLPAAVAAVLTALAWISVVAFHDEARWIGGGWMAVGILAYVVYRKGFEGTSLTEHVEVPAEALHKDVEEAEYGEILVPVFGTKLDDDIVGTAGRLADAADEPGETPPKLEVIYVVDLPLTVPLDSPPPGERMEVANRALERALEVGAEYDTVDVNISVVRARNVGAGIVAAARDRDVEVIVMGAEPPTKILGGAVLGGIGGSRPAEIGPVTEYVLKKAPCRVLVTAPAGDGARRARAGDGAAGARSQGGEGADEG
jgi:basic amino acid/polyamine antiporter, APA family